MGTSPFFSFSLSLEDDGEVSPLTTTSANHVEAVTREIFAIKVTVAGNDIRDPAPSYVHAQ